MSSQVFGGPKTLVLPQGWTMSADWKRAQVEPAKVNPLGDAEFMIKFGNGDGYHRVTFVIDSGDLMVDCDCGRYHHNDWCAHVARLWWQWSRGELVVHDVDTERPYQTPPAWLSVDREGEK